MATVAIVIPQLQRRRRRIRGSILSYSCHWHWLHYSSSFSFIGYSSIRKVSGRYAAGIDGLLIRRLDPFQKLAQTVRQDWNGDLLAIVTQGISRVV